MYTIDVSLKDHFFRWEGRLNRLRYIKRTLIIIALSIALYLITMTAVFLLLAQTGGNNTALNPIQGMLFAGLGLITLLFIPLHVASWMLMIRRLHDLDVSGYFSLLSLVPFINIGLIIYLLCKQGTDGDNTYGPDPLDPAGVCAPPPAYGQGIQHTDKAVSAHLDIRPPAAQTGTHAQEAE